MPAAGDVTQPISGWLHCGGPGWNQAVTDSARHPADLRLAPLRRGLVAGSGLVRARVTQSISGWLHCGDRAVAASGTSDRCHPADLRLAPLRHGDALGSRGGVGVTQPISGWLHCGHLQRGPYVDCVAGHPADLRLAPLRRDRLCTYCKRPAGSPSRSPAGSIAAMWSLSGFPPTLRSPSRSPAGSIAARSRTWASRISSGHPADLRLAPLRRHGGRRGGVSNRRHPADLRLAPLRPCRKVCGCLSTPTSPSRSPAGSIAARRPTSTGSSRTGHPADLRLAPLRHVSIGNSDDKLTRHPADLRLAPLRRLLHDDVQAGDVLSPSRSPAGSIAAAPGSVPRCRTGCHPADLRLAPLRLQYGERRHVRPVESPSRSPAGSIAA